MDKREFERPRKYSFITPVIIHGCLYLRGSSPIFTRNIELTLNLAMKLISFSKNRLREGHFALYKALSNKSNSFIIFVSDLWWRWCALDWRPRNRRLFAKAIKQTDASSVTSCEKWVLEQVPLCRRSVRALWLLRGSISRPGRSSMWRAIWRLALLLYWSSQCASGWSQITRMPRQPTTILVSFFFRNLRLCRAS